MIVRKIGLVLLVAGTCGGVLAQESKPAGGKVLYENNFENAAAGKLPDDFLVLDGAFAVQAEGGNKFLELPGAPLETFGVLFGPNETSDVAVSARIFSTAKGRRSPAFAVGLNGAGGYKLQVSPGKRAVELFKGDTVAASVPYAWEAGAWTLLRLQVRKLSASQWKVEGKVWKQGAPEPAAWTIACEEKTEPTAGRASVWGMPFSGTPIRFDDLEVRRVGN